MEEFQKNLKEAIKHLQIADHMTYVTFSLIKEKRLFLKIFQEIYSSVINCIDSIINYEYFCKSIPYRGHENNFEIFLSIAKNYGVSNEQIKKLSEILEVNQRYKKSSMEFVKNDKIVILSEDLNTHSIDLDIIKKYLFVTRDFIGKVSNKISFPKYRL